MRKCSDCLLILAISEFSTRTSNKKSRSYPMTICKKCDAKRKRELRAKRKDAGVCVRCGKVQYKSRLCVACYDYEAVRQKRKDQRLRDLILSSYGGKCACCEEAEPGFLTVDHVNNDGNIHRRHLKLSCGGTPFYTWIVRNKFPKDLQLLCWNCNESKRINKGECVHRTKKRLAIVGTCG